VIHLVTGGARSGKSHLALGLAEAEPGPIDFIATAEAHDAEMAARIRNHRAERGARYRTVEAPLALPEAVAALPEGGAVVIDCLTLWCANLIFAGHDDAALHARTTALVAALKVRRRPAVVVTNEVGLGIVPGDALSRRYRDELGRMNQRLAAEADRVSLMVAGIAVTLR